jgi:hypothetical protein
MHCGVEAGNVVRVHQARGNRSCSGVRAFPGGVNHAEGGVAIMPKDVWEVGRALA